MIIGKQVIDSDNIINLIVQATWSRNWVGVARFLNASRFWGNANTREVGWTVFESLDKPYCTVQQMLDEIVAQTQE